MKDQELFLDNASAIAYNRNITHKIDKYENQVRIGSEILEEHKKELKKIESDILIEETNKKNLGEEIKDEYFLGVNFVRNVSPNKDMFRIDFKVPKYVLFASNVATNGCDKRPCPIGEDMASKRKC